MRLGESVKHVGVLRLRGSFEAAKRPLRSEAVTFLMSSKNRCCKQNSYDDKLVINLQKSQTLRTTTTSPFKHSLAHLYQQARDVIMLRGRAHERIYVAHQAAQHFVGSGPRASA